MRFSLLLSITLLLLLVIPIHTQQSICETDPGCQKCNFYIFYTTVGLYGFYNCDQCYPNHTFNSTTRLCDCSKAYYSLSNGTCLPCKIQCATCTNQSYCTSCNIQYNRQLVNDQCSCINGYQSLNNDQMCYPKPNVLLITLSSIGSFFCVALSFICFWILRFRRSTLQIHQSTQFHRNQRNAQIQIYVEQDHSQTSAQGMNASSLWNTKQHEYKIDEICSICLDIQPYFFTQCGHYFHSKCIYEWLINHTTCPNCNKQINENEIKRWCQKCKKILMPIVRNILIKKSGKKKRKFVISLPIQHQFCQSCQKLDHQTNKQQFLH